MSPLRFHGGDRREDGQRATSASPELGSMSGSFKGGVFFLQVAVSFFFREETGRCAPGPWRTSGLGLVHVGSAPFLFFSFSLCRVGSLQVGRGEVEWASLAEASPSGCAPLCFPFSFSFLFCFKFKFEFDFKFKLNFQNLLKQGHTIYVFGVPWPTDQHGEVPICIWPL